MRARDASELLARAREFVEQPDPQTAGLWPRAAALLGRQALEQALGELWSRRAPGVEQLSARAQLTCLPVYLNDATLAGEIAFTWSALSDACHQHHYEIGPTADELLGRLDVVRRLLERLKEIAPARA